MPRFGDPEPLADHHVLEGFDCGAGSLNLWLLEHARQAAAGGSARTYVLGDAEQDRVVGYPRGGPWQIRTSVSAGIRSNFEARNASP